MKIIKALSVLLIITLLSAQLAVSGSAAAVPEIRVDTVTATPGKTVDVPVRFLNNPGINSYSLTVEYDSKYLTLNSVTSDVAGQFTYVKRAVWISSGDTDFSGTFLTLHFSVAYNAPEGKLPVTVSYNAGDICNYNEDDVVFTVTAGGVTVQKGSSLLGDINGDGKVNVVDSINLRRMILGNQAAVDGADLNGDGKVNIVDAGILRKIILGV